MAIFDCQPDLDPTPGLLIRSMPNAPWTGQALTQRKRNTANILAFTLTIRSLRDIWFDQLEDADRDVYTGNPIVPCYGRVMPEIDECHPFANFATRQYAKFHHPGTIPLPYDNHDPAYIEAPILTDADAATQILTLQTTLPGPDAGDYNNIAQIYQIDPRRIGEPHDIRFTRWLAVNDTWAPPEDPTIIYAVPAWPFKTGDTVACWTTTAESYSIQSWIRSVIVAT